MAPRIIGARKPLHHDKISLVIVFRCHALKCHQTHYPVNDQLCCPKCPIGSYVRSDCTENASISCRPCVTGTYMDSPTGLKICFPCKNCNAEADHTQSGEEREESSYRRLPRSPARLRYIDYPVVFASSDFIWFPRPSLVCRHFKSST
ncbi:uncharacterized protein ACBT44_005257 isoform 3-T3 [Syngnathus typhle]